MIKNFGFFPTTMVSRFQMKEKKTLLPIQIISSKKHVIGEKRGHE